MKIDFILYCGTIIIIDNVAFGCSDVNGTCKCADQIGTIVFSENGGQEVCLAKCDRKTTLFVLLELVNPSEKVRYLFSNFL